MGKRGRGRGGGRGGGGQGGGGDDDDYGGRGGCGGLSDQYGWCPKSFFCPGEAFDCSHQGGVFADMPGDGWSGGDRSTESHGPGRAGTGGGGAGGGPRSSAKGSNIAYQRVVPKFLQGHEDMMRGGSAMDVVKQAWDGRPSSLVPSQNQGWPRETECQLSANAGSVTCADHDKAEALRGYGDSDDEDAAARKGLGARSDGKGGKAALMAKALCTEGGLEAVRHPRKGGSRGPW
jgi:hypothetical protein